MLARVDDVYVRPENPEGTYLDPASSPYHKIAFDLQGDEEHEEIPRDTAGQSLSKRKSLMGRSTMKASFGMDLKGEGASAGVPVESEWAELLQACGVRKIRLKRLACSAGIIAGAPIAHGETLYEGIGALDLGYTGSAADMVITMAGGVLAATSVSEPADNFSFDTANASFDTLTELSGAIDALTHWTCTVNLGATGSHLSSQIFPGSFAIAASGSATIGYFNGTPATGRAVGSYAYAAAGGHTAVIYEPLTGAFASADEVWCNMLKSFAATSAPADNGWVFRPYSKVRHSLTTTAAGWTTGGTTVVGEILKGTKTGSADAYGLVLEGSGLATGSAQTLYFEPILGTFVDGMTLTGQTHGDTATQSGGTTPLDNYSLSLARIRDGMVEKARGCRGTFKLELHAGQPALIRFDFSGMSEGVADQVSLVSGNVDPGTPLRFQEGNFSVDGNAFVTEMLELELGATIAVRTDANQPEGGQSLMVTDRDPKARINPEYVPPGTFDWRTKIKDAAPVAVKVRMGAAENGLGKATQSIGNSIWVDIPNAQVLAAPKEDRDSILIGNIELACRTASSAGEDEFAIFHV